MELTCDVCSYKNPHVNKECPYYVTYRMTAVIKLTLITAVIDYRSSHSESKRTSYDNECRDFQN